MHGVVVTGRGRAGPRQLPPPPSGPGPVRRAVRSRAVPCRAVPYGGAAAPRSGGAQPAAPAPPLPAALRQNARAAAGPAGLREEHAGQVRASSSLRSFAAAPEPQTSRLGWDPSVAGPRLCRQSRGVFVAPRKAADERSLRLIAGGETLPLVTGQTGTSWGCRLGAAAVAVRAEEAAPKPVQNKRGHFEQRHPAQPQSAVAQAAASRLPAPALTL